MEIAENITWTEELERLDVLLSQGQFELLLPGERYGEEKGDLACLSDERCGRELSRFS